MPRYNKTFELDPNDIELIEAALRSDKRRLMDGQLSGKDSAKDAVRNIHDLLGRLHNQKEFYRPRKGVYVGG